MSSKKRRTVDTLPVPPQGAPEAPQQPAKSRWWMYLAGLAAALIAAFAAYGPALNGEFLFDDIYLPFLIPDIQNAPLKNWLGVRPVLMLSYWLNYKTAGLEPYWYHAVSVILHALNAMLVWLVLRRLLKFAGEDTGRSSLLALFGAGLFLLHPVQTESVAYVASRSETLSIFFFLAAYAVFLYRRGDALSIPRIFAVLLLFGTAATVKEHTIALPAILLLTDFYFTTPFRLEGIRRNWKLYTAILAAGLAGAAAVWRVLASAQTAGFQVQEFTWYQYLFTQFRVIVSYLRLFVLPVDLNGDYDYGVSRSIIDQGAFIALALLLVLAGAAIKYRRTYPLASFGFLAFLLLLAPTSSIIPIRDVIAERRLYLPFFALVLVVLDFLRRWRPANSALAAALSLVLVVAGFATYHRSGVWADALTFWSDTAAKSPGNARAHFQLAYAQWHSGNCTAAVANYEKVARLQKPDDRLLIDWALALECVGRVDDALAKLNEARRIAPSVQIISQIGMILGKHGRHEEALAALAEAESVDPNFDMTYVYRGNIFVTRGDLRAGAAEYERAFGLNPQNETARRALGLVQQRLGQPQ